MTVNEKIACVILAGGKGNRLDGLGKLNKKIGKKSLLEVVYSRIKNQFNILAINTKSKETKISFKFENIIYDFFKDNIGPLAGVHAAMKFTIDRLGEKSLLITVPVDTPFLPKNLAKKLHIEYLKSKANIVVAKSNGKTHPTIALWETEIVDLLEESIKNKIRKIDKFTSRFKVSYVNWDHKKVDPFFNINNYDDLNLAKSMLKI